ncbi:helix-turn-helix transcriptional regulator [Nesterenkonia sp. DZ6]|uniref:helix-turn-helix transcriptional regulator n=1 Tax=Nesterenkonia sp. DZ6 TaxID=2901229 RepID=UPI001F4C8240|nr:helix-turn-helix domain-containing protein [Nesterenkonia sp. DZ6]MCH8560347.1 helix-turn-helix domain-containing protein [Nesterenkonia sp. DZ6]
MRKLNNVRELGLAIRDARRSAGLTQLQLSKQANVSRRWLIAVENGEAKAPDATKIFDTLRALNISFGLGSPEEVPAPRPNQAAADALQIMDQQS